MTMIDKVTTYLSAIASAENLEQAKREARLALQVIRKGTDK